jgi:predicted nucleic acid-binding protein
MPYALCSLLFAFDLPDSSDDPFLEAALASTADVLITGSRKHFPKKSCKGQKVVSPTEFLNLLIK